MSTAELPAPLGAEVQRGGPRRDIGRRRFTRLEGEDLVPALDRSSVCEQRADRIAYRIVQVIKLSARQTIDCRQQRLARIREHAHQAPDRRCEARYRSDAELRHSTVLRGLDAA